MRGCSTSNAERIAKYGFLVSAALAGGAILWQTMAAALGVTLPVWEQQLVFDTELLGAGVGSLALVGSFVTEWQSALSSRKRIRPASPMYMTRGLFDVLCGLAEEKEPDADTVRLATLPVSHLTGPTDDVPSESPVFTHFYMPGVAESTRAVFGVDLGVPPGRTRGLFVSHPQGPLALTKRDELHGVVFVAVPPWDRGSVAAFDRHGREHPVRLVDAAPPEESVSGVSTPDRPTKL